MIIQSSNEPIIIKFSEDMTQIPMRITLWDNTNNKLKEWTNSDLIIENDTVTAPLKQEETAEFPKCMAKLEIKWLDSDKITKFSKKITIEITDRNDKTVMEV